MATAEEIREEFGIPRKAIVWPFFIFVYVLTGGNLVIAAGYFLGLASLVFIVDIVLLLFVTTLTVISLLASLPLGQLTREFSMVSAGASPEGNKSC